MSNKIQSYICTCKNTSVYTSGSHQGGPWPTTADFLGGLGMANNLDKTIKTIFLIIA